MQDGGQWEYHRRTRNKGRFARSNVAGVQLHVRVTPEEHAQVRAEANKRCMSMSEYVGWLIRREKMGQG